MKQMATQAGQTVDLGELAVKVSSSTYSRWDLSCALGTGFLVMAFGISPQTY